MLRSAETTTRSPSTGQTGWCSGDTSVANKTSLHLLLAGGLLLKADSAIDKPGLRMKFKVALATVEKQNSTSSPSIVCRPVFSRLYSMLTVKLSRAHP